MKFWQWLFQECCNVVVNSSLSSHTKDCKNKSLVLVEGTTDGINSNINTAEKKLLLTLLKKQENRG